MIKNTLFALKIVIFIAIIGVGNHLAYADAGVPMIAAVFPPLFLALLPVIYIETYVGYLILKKFHFREIQKAFAFANIFSTILGFPLAWIFLVILRSLLGFGGCGPGTHDLAQMSLTAIIEFTWLCPWKNNLDILVSIAFAINMIIAYFISVYSEYWILQKHFATSYKKTLFKISWISNSISYIFLVIISYLFWL